MLRYYAQPLFWKTSDPNCDNAIRFSQERVLCPNYKYKFPCNSPDVYDISLRSHHCDRHYPVAADTNVSYSEEKTRFTRPFNFKLDCSSNRKPLVLIYSFTRSSGATKPGDVERHILAHRMCYNEAKYYIMEKYENLSFRSVRRFHKCAPSHTTMKHCIASVNPFYPFSLLKDTLGDLPPFDEIEFIVFGVRHPISFGCSGYYLREYLEDIKKTYPGLWEKLIIFCSGFRGEDHEVDYEPILLSGEELVKSLQRYPVGYFEANDSIIKDPISCFLNSMFREFLIKGRGYHIGRSAGPIDMCVEIPKSELVENDPELLQFQTAMNDNMYASNTRRIYPPQETVNFIKFLSLI